MSVSGCQAIMALGGFFLVLGVAFIVWNRRERKGYYNSVMTKRDVKEFLTHEPERPWLNAWRVGGRISLVIGTMLVVAGAVLWLLTA
ncbi:MAG: hypothetical protein KAW95_02710 [Dehalococcoidia bacterium]|nr:hypothetical protein [Dehalococcoidia bacterium]